MEMSGKDVASGDDAKRKATSALEESASFSKKAKVDKAPLTPSMSDAGKASSVEAKDASSAMVDAAAANSAAGVPFDPSLAMNPAAAAAAGFAWPWAAPGASPSSNGAMYGFPFPYGVPTSMQPSGKMAIAPANLPYMFLPSPSMQREAMGMGPEGTPRKLKLSETQHFSLSTDDPSKRFLTTTHLNNKKLTFMRLDTVEKPASKSSGPTLRARCKLVKELISYLAGGTVEDERIFRAALAKYDKEAHVLALKDIGMVVEKARKPL